MVFDSVFFVSLSLGNMIGMLIDHIWFIISRESRRLQKLDNDFKNDKQYVIIDIDESKWCYSLWKMYTFNETKLAVWLH